MIWWQKLNKKSLVSQLPLHLHSDKWLYKIWIKAMGKPIRSKRNKAI
jgi:hypothetical protein